MYFFFDRSALILFLFRCPQFLFGRHFPDSWKLGIGNGRQEVDKQAFSQENFHFLKAANKKKSQKSFGKNERFF